MSQRRDLLIERYAEHYKRVSYSIDPHTIDPRHLQSMQLMYGDFVTGLPPGSKVLDLGCGTGFLLNWLSQQPGIVPVGVDSSVTQVEIAMQKLQGIEISCKDGLDYLREHPDTFSGIFCINVLEHIPGKDLCLEWVEAARAALYPGGFFLCSIPNAANLTGSYGRYIDLTHEQSFTTPSILQLLEAGGLQDCRIVPIRSTHLSGRLRLVVEALLHKILFRICGRGLEQVFTKDICAIGFRR